VPLQSLRRLAASSETALEFQNHIQTHDANLASLAAFAAVSEYTEPLKVRIDRKPKRQLAQGILGKVTLTSIIEDCRKANPLAELPRSRLSCLHWDHFYAPVTRNDINMLSLRRYRNPIRDLDSMHDKLR
jgi:hypothetical protein